MVSASPPAWADYQAVLFDLDGVITPTAEIHQRAWAELFAPYSYTKDDYLRYIDGKPRYEGVQAFLASRSIDLPLGSADDPPGNDTVSAMGNAKNEVFTAILERDSIAPYPGTLALMAELDGLGIAQAVVSSSKNARVVLQSAGLGGHFAVVVDGMTAVEQGLPGKPDPAMFAYAAQQLSVAVDRSVVIEDAVAGVAAGKAGGFGFTLGVDRGGNRQALLDAGADTVTEDLGLVLLGNRSGQAAPGQSQSDKAK